MTEKQALIQRLATTLFLICFRRVRSVLAFMNQPPDTTDSNPSFGRVKRRGRPPSNAKLAELAQIRCLGNTRPNGPVLSPLRKPVSDKQLLQPAAKAYGLDHATTPTRLLIDALLLDEPRDRECEAINPDAPSYADYRAPIQTRFDVGLKQLRESIASAAKAGGEKTPGETRLSIVQRKAPGVFEKLELGTSSYKQAIRDMKLTELDASEIPSERTLRRWIRERSAINSPK
jgi:hypothetical protein